MESNSNSEGEPEQRPPSQPIEEDYFEEEEQDHPPPPPQQQSLISSPQLATLVLGGAAANNTQSQDFTAGGGSHQGQGAEELEKNLDDASNLLETETGLFHQRMWASFQSCARAVAQVYMSNKPHPMPGPHPQPAPAPTTDHHPPKPVVEESFKSAAQHATNLYKDSLETSRRLIDLAIKTGSNRRTKEILSFVKSRKKRFIKRDELISYLIGKSSSSSFSGSRKSQSHSVLDWGHSAPQWTGGGVHGAFSMITYSSPQAHSSLPPHCSTDPQHHNSQFQRDQPSNQRNSSAQPLANSSSDDPAMLHLAVEQLFVEQYVQAAGVKRAAKDEDEAMEDEGDGAFKRMRFY